MLDVRDLRISFSGTPVVHDISFSIAPGEKLALVGESGSGKSVGAMSLLGLVPGAAVSGQAGFAGQDLLSLPPHALQALRGRDISVIFQEPMTALNPVHTIGQQIAEVFQVKLGLDRRTAWARAVERLAATGIPEPARRAKSYPHQLSGGQRQRAMIAMALASEPRLLIADEPTTALDATLRLQILDLLAELQRKNGMSVLLISHDLNLVRRFADRVAVMEKGHLVEQGDTATIFASPRHPYTRKLINSKPVRNVVETDAPETVAQARQRVVRLRAGHLRVGYRVSGPGLRGLLSRHEFVAVKDASFEVAAGQTLGIIGESGSGKSTLAHAVLGLLRHQGRLSINDRTWDDARRAPPAARKAQRRTVQAVFQDPYSSLSPRMSVAQLVGEGLRFHEPGLSAQNQRQRIVEVLEDVGLHESQFPQLLDRKPHEFSGGQRQRLAIARALIVQPEVLVLDEPTSALDVTIQKQILALLQKLQKEHGLSYVLITHDMDVVRAMAHHAIVMKDGDIVEAGDARTLFASPSHPYTQRLLEAAG